MAEVWKDLCSSHLDQLAQDHLCLDGFWSISKEGDYTVSLSFMLFMSRLEKRSRNWYFLGKTAKFRTSKYSTSHKVSQAFQIGKSIALMSNLFFLIIGLNEHSTLPLTVSEQLEFSYYSLFSPSFVYRRNENEKYKARAKWECESKQSCKYVLPT